MTPVAIEAAKRLSDKQHIVMLACPDCDEHRDFLKRMAEMVPQKAWPNIGMCVKYDLAAPTQYIVSTACGQSVGIRTTGSPSYLMTLVVALPWAPT